MTRYVWQVYTENETDEDTLSTSELGLFSTEEKAKEVFNHQQEVIDASINASGYYKDEDGWACVDKEYNRPQYRWEVFIERKEVI